MLTGAVPVITSLPTAPYDIVINGWKFMSDIATASVAQSTSFARGLYDFAISPVEFTVTFTPPPITTAPAMPAAPTSPDVAISPFVTPDPLTLQSVPAISPAVAPTLTAQPPVLAFTDRPADLTAVAPSEVPTVATPAAVDRPTIVVPDVPTMLDLNIPVIPATNIPLFTDHRPTDDMTPPDIGLVWAEDAYSPSLTNLSSKLVDMLQFDYDAAETAIWERGQERIQRTTNLNSRQLFNDFAARGFSMPSGVLLEADMELRAKAGDQLADNAREAMIKAAEINKEKLATAIQFGVMYEGQLMNFHGQVAQRALEGAKAMADIAISVFNARVTIFNTRVQAYRTDAEVYNTLVQAELTKLQQYKLELEGQQLISGINQQRIEMYKAQYQAVMSAVELYKAELDGARLSVEVDRARIEGFKATVDAYTSMVGAKSAEYQAWGETIKAESVKMGAYETEVRAFAATVDAYKTGESVKIEQNKLIIDQNRALIEEFRAGLEYLSEQIKSEVARVTAATQVYDGQSRVYSAAVGAVEATGRMNVANTQLAIAEGQATADVYLKSAELKINETLRNAQVQVGAMEAGARTTAQLAGSALSAFNMTTSVGASSSYGWTQQLQESWSGSLPAA